MTEKREDLTPLGLAAAWRRAFRPPRSAGGLLLTSAVLAEGLWQMDPRNARIAAYLFTMGVTDLAPGERRVVDCLLGRPLRYEARTYDQAAQLAGVHIGTVRRVLVRLRYEHPDLHRAVLGVRGWQLRWRHSVAEARARHRRHERARVRWRAYRAGVTGVPWARPNAGTGERIATERASLRAAGLRSAR
jgi:hypothetical protein